MNCTTPDDFNSAIEFGRIINETKPNQAAEVTVTFLDNTSGNVTKLDKSYQAIGGTAKIKESVTEKAGRLKPFRGKANPLLDQQADLGQYVHDVSEMITQDIVNAIGDKSNDYALTYVKNINTIDEEGLKKINQMYGKTLDNKSKVRVLEGVKENLLIIYRQQRTINKLTGKEGKVTIRLKQIVIDPKNGIGGTIDFLAIFSDNTAAIIDYKTKIVTSSNQDAFGNIINIDKVIYPQAVEKYKLQTGEYGRILRESYGVKSIANITIIPIKINVKLDKKLGKYGNKIENLAFPGQDPLLEKILPFSNSTRFKSLDEFIRAIDERIQKLEQKIKSNPSQREELSKRIKELNNGRKDILINHNMDTILNYGKSLSEKVKKGEMGELSVSELQDLIHEMQLLASIAESTYEYRKSLKGTTKEKDLDEIEQKIGLITRELKDRIEELKVVLFEDKITKLIEIHTGYKITDDFGNYVPFAQEGYMGKWFYQLSQYDNPIFKTLRSILDDINYKVRQKTEAVVENIKETEDKVYTWLNNTGRSFEDLITIMINPKNDNFWGKYSSEYFDKINSAKPEELHTFYEPSETYEEWYTQALFKKANQLKDEGVTGEELNKLINSWVSQNDLSVVDGEAVHPEAWEQAKRFNRLHLKDNPKAYNENYKFIMSVPELKAYYEMFETYNKEFRGMLGVDYNQLPNNFLPNIRKSMTERVAEHGAGGLLTGVQDYLKDFSIREEDRSADSTYNSNSQIPIFFLNPFRAEDKSLMIGEKSYQFGRSLAIFAKMAYNYEASTEQEANILALQEFLSTEAEQLTQSRGRNLIDKMGNNLTEKLQATELPEIFQSFVDMYLYRINVKSIIGDKSGKAEKMLLKAKEYFTLKVLGFNVIAGLGSLATAKINSMIEANKGIIFNKDNYTEAMKASWSERDKFLAINAYFDPMSHRLNNPAIGGEKKYGERQYGDPTMRGWVNKYVNARMLMNTFSIGDEYIEEMITAAMAKNYYLDSLGNFRRVKNEADRQLNEKRLIWNLFSYSKEDGAKLDLTPEQTEIAFKKFRRAVQAGQSRIKGTIPEEDKAHWQNNIVMQLVMHFKSWMPGIMFERFGKVKFDDRIQSIYLGKYVALGKELIIPEDMVFQEYVKKILLPKLSKLTAHVLTFGIFGKTKLNDVHNKQLFFEKWLEANPHFKGEVSFEDFNEVQQKQLKSVVQELRVLIMFTILALLMMGDWDDDNIPDYRKYLLTRKIVSALLKTQQELSFVFDPASFASMVKSPIPSIGLIIDAQKTIVNTFDELFDLAFGEERLIGGTDGKDKTPIGSQSIKWVPGLGGFARFIDFFNADTQYLNTQ